MLAITIWGVLVALAYTQSRTDKYDATARIAIGPAPSGALDGRLTAPNLEREAEVVVGDSIASEVAETVFGESAPQAARSKTKVRFQPDSEVMRIEVRDRDPERAALIANLFAQIYTNRRLDAQAAYFNTLDSAATDQVTELGTELAALEDQLADNDAQRTRLLVEERTIENQQELDRLQSERGTLVSQIGAANTLLRTATAELNDIRTARLTDPAAGEVILTAPVPKSPRGLPDAAFWIAGGLLGLIAGIVLAFVAQRLDQSASTPGEVEAALRTRIIGAVPAFRANRRRGERSVVMALDGKSSSLMQEKEAFRRLRSSIQFLTRTEGHKTVAITSTHPSEGKTTVAANLALAFAASGNRVALLSGDLRRPALEGLFSIGNNDGLSLFLVGARDKLHYQTLPDYPNLLVFPAGPEPPNPGELLGSRRFADAIAALEDRMDIVIVDTPPLRIAADVLAAAPNLDGVFMVVDGQVTALAQLSEAQDQLTQAGTQVLGAIMNRAKRSRLSWLHRRRYAYKGGRSSDNAFDQDDDAPAPEVPEPARDTDSPSAYTDPLPEEAITQPARS